MSTISASDSASTPLPEKIALLVHEARWLLVGLAGLYLCLVLWGFDRADPGWSHAAAMEQIVNPGGRFGAWLSDLLLYLFGLSAWWWVVLPFFLLARGYHRLSHLFGGDRRSLLIALAGFLLLLLASCGLEALRFWSMKSVLPLAPGGMLGIEVGRFIAMFLGYTGGTLILLVLAMIGFSLFTGVSWIAVAEKSGLLLEGAWVGLRSLWDGWQDRRYGRAVAEQREEVVETERRKVEESPVRIEPVEIVVPVAPKAIARAEKERQAPLFFDAPGGALPPLHLLAEPSHNPADLPAAETLEFTSRLIERKLADFNVEAKVLTAHPGPVVTRYEIEPAVGVKGSQIVGLAKDLARALSLVSIRVVETVPGKSCMALELPNPKRQIVRLSEIIGSQAYHGMHSPLSMAMGKDIGGQPVVVDLAKMPHLLVAGTTGSGKSVGVNAMILSLIYKSEPKDVRMIMVDPKMLELSIYEGIPHLLAPVVTDMTKAANALHWCVGEMERRYKLMSALGVRNLSGFNSKINEAKKAGESIPNPFSLTANTEIGPEPLEPLPYIVVVIDELADLMMTAAKDVENCIVRLAQLARAAGIHMILATQRPSVDVVTGLIKANFPTRISFQVTSRHDSRTILDTVGAERLLGKGDMLYKSGGSKLKRMHGAYVDETEIEAVVAYWKARQPQQFELDFTEWRKEGEAVPGAPGEGVGSGVADDPMYAEALEFVTGQGRASISLIQRRFRIGFNRAARYIEQMEADGLLGAADGSKPRVVINKTRD